MTSNNQLSEPDDAELFRDVTNAALFGVLSSVPTLNELLILARSGDTNAAQSVLPYLVEIVEKCGVWQIGTEEARKYIADAINTMARNGDAKKAWNLQKKRGEQPWPMPRSRYQIALIVRQLNQAGMSLAVARERVAEKLPDLIRAHPKWFRELANRTITDDMIQHWYAEFACAFEKTHQVATESREAIAQPPGNRDWEEGNQPPGK